MLPGGPRLQHPSLPAHPFGGWGSPSEPPRAGEVPLGKEKPPWARRSSPGGGVPSSSPSPSLSSGCSTPGGCPPVQLHPGFIPPAKELRKLRIMLATARRRTWAESLCPALNKEHELFAFILSQSFITTALIRGSSREVR